MKRLFPWHLTLPAGYRRYAWLSMVSDVLNLLVTTRSEIFLLALLTCRRWSACTPWPSGSPVS